MAPEIIPADLAIARYLQKERACERQELKQKMFILRGRLHEKDIVVPLCFTPYGKSLYSEDFNRDICFLESCGIVNEKMIGNHLVYMIDPGGEERISQYLEISKKAVKELDLAIDYVFKNSA